MSLDVFDKIHPFAERIEFIGSAGDFIYHPQSLEFLERIPHKGFVVETNGSIKDSEYWKKLATYTKQENQIVIFAIDDILREVNPYRKVKTAEVLKNFNAFVEAGGNAFIKVLLFDFNENQIEQMKERFKGHKIMFHSSEEYSDEFKPPSIINILAKQGTSILSDDLFDVLSKRPITHCTWAKEKKIFIFEDGEVQPCCNFNPHDINYRYGKIEQLYPENKHLININNYTLQEIMNTEYFKYVYSSFNDIPRCRVKCNNLLKLAEKNMIS